MGDLNIDVKSKPVDKNRDAPPPSATPSVDVLVIAFWVCAIVSLWFAIPFAFQEVKDPTNRITATLVACCGSLGFLLSLVGVAVCRRR